MEIVQHGPSNPKSNLQNFTYKSNALLTQLPGLTVERVSVTYRQQACIVSLRMNILYVGKGKKNMNEKERNAMIEPEQMMVGKEEVDHEHVSLPCSTQVGSPSVSLWYVL